MNSYILSSQYGSKEEKLSSYLSKMRKKHIIECFEGCLFFLGKNPKILSLFFWFACNKIKNHQSFSRLKFDARASDHQSF